MHEIIYIIGLVHHLHVNACSLVCLVIRRFLQLFEKYNVKRKNVIKLKSPGELQVLCLSVCLSLLFCVCQYLHHVI